MALWEQPKEALANVLYSTLRLPHAWQKTYLQVLDIKEPVVETEDSSGYAYDVRTETYYSTGLC